MEDGVLEVRCPKGSNNLLLKMRADPDSARGVSVDNTLLIMCRDCTKYERRKSHSDDNFRVIHEFSVFGDYIGSFHEVIY